eukprot:1408967-Rhodomonas_salina.4
MYWPAQCTQHHCPHAHPHRVNAHPAASLSVSLSPSPEPGATHILCLDPRLSSLGLESSAVLLGAAPHVDGSGEAFVLGGLLCVCRGLSARFFHKQSASIHHVSGDHASADQDSAAVSLSVSDSC